MSGKWRCILIEKRYELICDECGKKYGHMKENHIATYYYGHCDYCNTDKIVTEARDYGYPKPIQ